MSGEYGGDEDSISGPGQVMLRSLILVYRPIVPKLLKWEQLLPILKALYKQAV